MAERWPDALFGDVVTQPNQIATIRQAVDAAYGTPAYPFTWTGPGSQSPILPQYVTELRGAVQELWNRRSMGTVPNWTAGDPPAPGQVWSERPSDITDLRLWLNRYLDTPAKQGVDTLSYAQDWGNEDRPISGTAWVSDTMGLGGTNAAIQQVRLAIVARGDPNHVNFTLPDLTSEEMEKFRVASGNFSSSTRVFLAFPDNFYHPAPPAPQPSPDDPGPNPMNDPYVVNFALRVDGFVRYIRQHGTTVKDFIIFNEPGGKLHADLFAALLYRCWEKLNSIDSSLRMYWGGIFFSRENATDPNWVDPHATHYIDTVYGFLQTKLREGDVLRNWWWHGINIHIHRDRPASGSSDQYLAILNEVEVLRTKWGDAGELILGEWGITSEEWGSRPSSNPFLLDIYNRLRSRKRAHPSLMFFFSHQYVDERSQSIGQWGLTKYDVGTQGSPPIPVFTPETGSPPDGRTVLYTPFKNAMNSADST